MLAVQQTKQMESYMAQVQAGTILSNNDPREQTASGDGGVQIQVAGVDEQYAYYYTTRRNRIRLDRIFDDGRKRAVGWSVVKHPDVVKQPETQIEAALKKLG